ncbi:MAG TPA: MFS transporter [Solirubrobacterales bacterium]|nr:MFS transporter [Solirubrobacterales bacterium]
MRNKAPILILGMAQFLMVLDTTVMNVSISEVVSDLDTSVSSVQLAITAYALVMGSCMLIGAKLGDKWGRRTAFRIGLAVYGLGSFITAISPNVAVLMLGWSGIEGIGAVLVVPAIASLAAATYEGKDRALAFGIIGGIAGAGAAAGPLIGGWVTTELSWRVVFASESVIVVGILLASVKLIPSPATDRSRIDLLGSVLSVLGLGLIVLGILKGGEWGFLMPAGAMTINGTEITPFGFSAVPFLVGLGIGSVCLFAVWEERQKRLGRPVLLDPALLRIPQLRGGLSMQVSQNLIIAGTFFILPLYLQLVLGKDAFETGLKLLPISVTMMAAATLGPKLSERYSPRLVVQVGLAVLALAILGVMSTISPELTGTGFGVSLALFGVGVGLVTSQLGNVVMSSVPTSRSSEVGGLQGAALNLGSSLGTALIGAILLSGLASGFHEKVTDHEALPPQVQRLAQEQAESGIPMISIPEVEAATEEAGLPPDQVTAISDSYGEAQIEGLKQALFFTAIFAFAGIWFARKLPTRLT